MNVSERMTYSLKDLILLTERKGFLITYGAICAYDIYDYFKGDIKKLPISDSEGNVMQKECRVYTFDVIKCVANSLPIAAVIAPSILDHLKISSVSIESQEMIVPMSLAGSIVLEIYQDVFNSTWTITDAHEINSDNSLIIG